MVVLVIEAGMELATRLRASLATCRDLAVHHVEPASHAVAAAARALEPAIVLLGTGVSPQDSIRPLSAPLGPRGPAVFLARAAVTEPERRAWAREGVALVYDLPQDYTALLAVLEAGAALLPPAAAHACPGPD